MSLNNSIYVHFNNSSVFNVFDSRGFRWRSLHLFLRTEAYVAKLLHNLNYEDCQVEKKTLLIFLLYLSDLCLHRLPGFYSRLFLPFFVAGNANSRRLPI